jgi:adenylate cyclase
MVDESRLERGSRVNEQQPNSRKVKFYNKYVDPDTVWLEWFTTSAFDVDKRLRRTFRMLPRDPRCKFCNAPFQGVGGIMVQALFGKRRSDLNPRFCNMCDEASRKFPGGSEVEMSLLFADIRGSTALSEKMSPTEYSRLIHRFYAASTKVIIEADGLVEKLAGDEVVAFWGAGFAGANYVRRTVQVAQELSRAMAREGIPVGIGVHFGVAYFGAMGTAEGLTDISAKGEEVNTAARLASKAGVAEIIISEQALKKAGIDGSELEPRRLELKGISEPVLVRVMHGS